MYIEMENVDNYRKHWEINKHWNMRKEFILAHHDSIEKDRLLCLAQLYVNTRVMKNEYDQAIMNEVNALAAKIPKK